MFFLVFVCGWIRIIIESRIQIRIRVTSWIGINVNGRIWIRLDVKRRIRICINVTRIRYTDTFRYHRHSFSSVDIYNKTTEESSTKSLVR